jgi:hypothetical protein
MTQQELGIELIRIGTAMRLGHCHWPEPGSPVALMLHALVEEARRVPRQKRLADIVSCEVVHDTSETSRMEMTVRFRPKDDHH